MNKVELWLLRRNKERNTTLRAMGVTSVDQLGWSTSRVLSDFSQMIRTYLRREWRDN